MPSTKVVVRAKKGYNLRVLLGGVALIITCIFLISSGTTLKAKVVGWVGLVFFGGCSLVIVRRISSSGPRLVIDENGVYDETLGSGNIPWDDIEGATLRSIKQQQFICLQVKDSDKYLSSPIARALGAANVKLGFTPICLNVNGVEEDPERICELIEKEVAARKQPGAL